MSILRPTLALNLAEAPGILDPRAAFVRATTGTTLDRMGVLRTIPAGVPRARWHPTTGVPQGWMFEPQVTNLAIQNTALDNAAWTKTNCSISANAATAPDGTAAADTITVSGASGNVNQAVTITAGNAITFSAYFIKAASSHALLRLTDGTNTVSAWFNLAAGTVGSNSAGAGTLVYSAHSMEAMADGSYRCQVIATSSTVTSITIRASAAAADNTEPANGDTVRAWGLQAEAPATTGAATTVIATAGSTVTRNGDVLLVPTATSWFGSAEGAMLLEWVDRAGGGSSRVLGGIGDTFSNTLYLSRTSTTVIYTVLSGGVQQAQPTVALAQVAGAIQRIAIAWKAADFAISANGAAPTVVSSGAIPASTARLVVGGAPFSASPSSQPGVPIRRMLYWPKRLSNAALQTISQ